MSDANDLPIRKTRSVCPVCLKNLPALLCRAQDGAVNLDRTCPEHGRFPVQVWQGLMNFETWTLGADPLAEGAGLSCPQNCGLCGEHESGTCCVLLEVTKRCSLQCRYCFANGGSADADPAMEDLQAAVKDIVRQCGRPLLQLSGGEPTLRDDLPDLVRFAKEAGCGTVQINTNGLRLAEDPAYAGALAKAGTDIIFLQLDGTRDDIYVSLRGRALLQTKLQAVRVCADQGLGVTLVPTVVPGVNDGDLGNIVRLAASLVPAVRCVHFQPVSYFGRYPAEEPQASAVPADRELSAGTDRVFRIKDALSGTRYTLDKLMTDLARQTGIPVSSFLPSRCDHPLCGFRARFLTEPDLSLRPLTDITQAVRTRGTAKDSRDFVARHWAAPGKGDPAGVLPAKKAAADGSLSFNASSCAGPASSADFSASMDFDTFLSRLQNGSLILSAMAFQDASNLNIERLHRCSLHVWDRGRIVPFCARYLTAWE